MVHHLVRRASLVSPYDLPGPLQLLYALVGHLGPIALTDSARRQSIIKHLAAKATAQHLFLASDNTAKLSPLIIPRTISYAASTNPPPPRRTAFGDTSMNDGKKGRRRRSSSLLYQEPPESIEHMSDQSALPNLNADWVNAKGELESWSYEIRFDNGRTETLEIPKQKRRPDGLDPYIKQKLILLFSRIHKTLTSLVSPLGAWTIHIVLIIALKILFDIIPGVSQETSWTLTNITYMFGSYLMFHWVQGVPFEFNAGAYDNLNMWEQIDNGDQYTPAKKFLLIVPILLFLLSTHYTHYDFIYFTINFLAVLGVVIPKLPWVRKILILPFG